MTPPQEEIQAGRSGGIAEEALLSQELTAPCVLLPQVDLLVGHYMVVEGSDIDDPDPV